MGIPGSFKGPYTYLIHEECGAWGLDPLGLLTLTIYNKQNKDKINLNVEQFNKRLRFLSINGSNVL